MAASVTYRINGKYDGKAVTQAKSGLSSLSNSAKSLNTVLKGIGVGVSVGALISQFKECTKTFKENNTAQTQMFQALSSNTKIAQESVKGLVKEFDKMSGVFGGSDIVKGGTILASMGLDETQMKKTAKAAKDLASSGLMSLEQAFDTLGKSYSGNITSLKKMFPELEKFTKAELEAGKAVEFLGDKFKGMEDAMGQTFEGQITILKDKIDGIKNSVGAIGGFLLQNNIGDITNLVDKVTYLSDTALPQIAAYASTIVHTFANFDLGALFDPKTIWEGWKNFFTTLAENFIMTIQWLKAKLGEGVNKVQLNNDKNWLENLEGRYAELQAKQNSNLQKYQKPFLTDFDRQEFEALTNQIAELKESIADRELQDTIKTKGLGELMKDIVGNYGQLHQQNLGLLGGFDGEAYFKSQVEAFKAYAGGGYLQGGSPAPVVVTDESGNPVPVSTNGVTDLTGTTTTRTSYRDEVLGLFGEIGSLISAGFDGSVVGELLKGVGTFINELATKAPAFGQLLNVVSEAAKFIVSPELVKMVNAISGPIMSGITAMMRGINQILAPIFEALAPVFWAIGKTLDFVGRTIETISAVIYNIYVALWNFFHVGSRNDKSYKSVSDIWSGFNDWDNYNIEASSVAASSSGTAASYNAQRDVYVTINYNHSFVNGDAREIALQIHNELTSAGRLGYL